MRFLLDSDTCIQFLNDSHADIRRQFFAHHPSDDACVHSYGQLRSVLATKGEPIGANDMLIAAIGLTHKLTVVTHNTREFARVDGLKPQDWET